MSNLNAIQRATGATSTADLRKLGNIAGRLKSNQLSDLNTTQRRTGATSPADLRKLANRPPTSASSRTDRELSIMANLPQCERLT